MVTNRMAISETNMIMGASIQTKCPSQIIKDILQAPLREKGGGGYRGPPGVNKYYPHQSGGVCDSYDGVPQVMVIL